VLFRSHFLVAEENERNHQGSRLLGVTAASPEELLPALTAERLAHLT
jgi:hypothetical protein